MLWCVALLFCFGCQKKVHFNLKPPQKLSPPHSSTSSSPSPLKPISFKDAPPSRVPSMSSPPALPQTPQISETPQTSQTSETPQTSQIFKKQIPSPPIEPEFPQKNLSKMPTQVIEIHSPLETLEINLTHNHQVNPPPPPPNTTKVNLSFRAYNYRGFPISDLQKEDLIVTDNQQIIQNPVFFTDVQKAYPALEIVFVLDTTEQKHIHWIKNNIDFLAQELAFSDLNARFCLVTFKDLLIKQCHHFVQDNPSTPENENLMSFLNDLSRQQVGGGGKLNTENALEGLLATARDTPWEADSQRMIVLVTDALFWVRPFATLDVDGRTAPFYSQDIGHPGVLEELEDSQAQLFAITRDISGFSKNYFEFPSLVEVTSGQWFPIKKLEKSQITMKDIFDTILKQVHPQSHTLYTIEYFAKNANELNANSLLQNIQISFSPYFINRKMQQGFNREKLQQTHIQIGLFTKSGWLSRR